MKMRMRIHTQAAAAAAAAAGKASHTHHVREVGSPVKGGVRGNELAALVGGAVDERRQLWQLRYKRKGVLECRLPILELADTL